jgi:hypothetical protein
VLWHILCLPVAHKFQSLFVPCCGTFCAFPWHMVFCSFLSRIQVKNCKSRIAKNNFLDSLDFFSRGLMNERVFSLVTLISCFIGCRDISCCPTGNIPTMFYLSGHFPLPNRKCPDTQKVSEHFLLGCRDISCCPIGNIPTRKSVGTFPIGVVGTFLVVCVGTSTGSVSGHFYRPFISYRSARSRSLSFF